MIKSIAIRFGKKYIIKALNELLEKNKDNVQKISTTLKLWISRLDVILQELRLVLNRVEDNKIDDDEIKDSIAEIDSIVKGW